MFINRKDAGEQLGEKLEKYQSMHPLILGIPRGGIEVGYYAALHLECDFDTIIVRKLGYPQQPEAAFGAIAEDGTLYLDPWLNQYINKEIIEQVVGSEKEEIHRRIKEYRHGRRLPDLKERVVILIDDGIASGATLFAAIEMCRKRHPGKLVVAAPVSGTAKLSKFKAKVDELIILEKREKFFAVSEGYVDFANLNDKQVKYFLEQWQQKISNEVPPDQ
ncbi:MAG TPA: phosphoribosyltransferase family protein [Balneolaceae bacterium]|nr:phosphoribosyltransferase family protein [Balneolaceae bacterium]